MPHETHNDPSKKKPEISDEERELVHFLDHPELIPPLPPDFEQRVIKKLEPDPEKQVEQTSQDFDKDRTPETERSDEALQESLDSYLDKHGFLPPSLPADFEQRVMKKLEPDSGKKTEQTAQDTSNNDAQQNWSQGIDEARLNQDKRQR